MEWEVLVMTFDLVELLQYLDLHGSTAIIAIMTMFICWVLFSSSNIANKIRIKVIEGFSMASSSIHTDKERLAEQISADIDEVLEHLQTETKADNVLVVRFRNGSYDSVGNSILKSSSVLQSTLISKEVLCAMTSLFSRYGFISSQYLSKVGLYITISGVIP
jgi:hypothetical protein